MQKWQLAAVFLGIAIITSLTCGCMSQASLQQPIPTATATIPPPSVTVKETTRPVACHMEGEAKVCLYTDMTPPPLVTAMKKTVTVPTPEEIPQMDRLPEEISGSIAQPITLTGVGNQIVWFETQAPGVVNFKMRYSAGLGEVKNCEEKKFEVSLAGKSVDTKLYSGGSGSTQNPVRTFNLLSPSRYSLSVKGCWGWQITVS